MIQNNNNMKPRIYQPATAEPTSGYIITKRTSCTNRRARSHDQGARVVKHSWDGTGPPISSRETVYGMARTIPVPRRGIGGDSARGRKEGPYVGLAWEKNWPIASIEIRAVDLKWRKSCPAYEIRFL